MYTSTHNSPCSESGSHTATQSTFAAPCTALQGGVDSGPCVFASSHTLPCHPLTCVLHQEARCGHTTDVQLHRDGRQPSLVLLRDWDPLQIGHGLRGQPVCRPVVCRLPGRREGRVPQLQRGLQLQRERDRDHEPLRHRKAQRSRRHHERIGHPEGQQRVRLRLRQRGWRKRARPHRRRGGRGRAHPWLPRGHLSGANRIICSDSLAPGVRDLSLWLYVPPSMSN